MEYIGRKVEKEARSGAVAATEEVKLAELSLLPSISGRNLADFDLNTSAEIDLNDDGDRREGGGLHGLDLNEGVNYILHDEFDSNRDEIPAPKGLMIDLNLDLNHEAAETSGANAARCFDLNVELEDDDDDEDCRIVAAPAHGDASTSASGGERWMSNIASIQMELMRRQFLMPSFPAQNYASFAAGIYNFNQFVPPPPPSPPPKVDLPPTSNGVDLKGASLLDFLSVYAFLRSFSVSLHLSPFEIDDFAAAVISNDATSLLDSVHLALLTTLRRHLMSLADEGCESASVCLRSLNWDLLDSITWPVFLVEYLSLHSPGLDLSELKPFQSDYYTTPAPAKVAILQHLCDDALQTEAFTAEMSRRGGMEDGKESWRGRYFSGRAKKGGSDLAEDCLNEFVVDGNGDECYLCKTDGNLICCDGCPAAFHARCVGVATSLLPEGSWFCPECAADRGKAYAPLTMAIRAPELLGTDPHARRYYTCCDYLLVADSCGEDYSLSLYRRDDVPAVVAALETTPSASLYGKIAGAIRRHWNLLGHGKAADDSADDGASTSGNNGEGAIINYVNLYEFGRTAFTLSKELASKWSEEDDLKSLEKILASQMRVVLNNKYASFSWSNIQNMSSATRKEGCGWCCSCKAPELERDCLFVLNDSVRATEGFTSQTLGIERSGDGMKNHLVDLICHIVWMEDRLHGLLSGPWSDPQFSRRWRRNAVEAAHIGGVKSLLLQLESNLHRRALSADWTKNLPRPYASKASRLGGCKKIEGVSYPDSGDYAKRLKCVAWKAAVTAAKTTEQLALQVRLLDANIKWNAVENIDLLPEKESKKPAKSFKDVVIRKRRHEGEVVKYLIDFGKNLLIPDVVGKHGSLLEGCSSNRKKYWLEESYVPLHLVKEYGQKRLARASTKDVAQEIHEGSGGETQPAEKKEAFQFERAERLERSICEHCNECVLNSEAHANEATTSSSTIEPLYTCQKCSVQHSNRNNESSSVQTMKRRERGGDPEKDLWSIVDNAMPKRRRADTRSSYWLNGLHCTIRTDDERLIQFRSKMLLLLPGEDAPNNMNPRCGLCGEMELARHLIYVACEKCGAWFHGDALDLNVDRVENVIGFECHSCLDKRPPACPHQRPAGNQ